MRRPMGNYYGNVTEHRNGKCYGRQVARQAKTQRAAMDAIDATGLPGYVQYWIEREQRRVIVCERDANGTWTSRNPYTGERVEIKREDIKR